MATIALCYSTAHAYMRGLVFRKAGTLQLGTSYIALKARKSNIMLYH
jgi:hypothetical protein